MPLKNNKIVRARDSVDIRKETMFSVKLQNIKGIRELEFPFPEQSGVYVLTGANGCGKTSLLVALNRIGDRYSFRNNYKVSHDNKHKVRIDTFNEASVTYRSDAGYVVYRKVTQRWVPTPQNNSNLISSFPFVNTLYISTTGLRTFSQEEISVNNLSVINVSEAFSQTMNNILGTDKFQYLKYITVKNIRGRQVQLHRNNKLYVITDADNNFYSEKNFSLGERLLLNTLDALSNVSHRTLLLIDEVELALHPVAQVRFYDYLKGIAQEKNLAVIISTHSSTLIKHAEKNLYYLENNNGIVTVHQDCYPAYILRSVAAIEDCRPDFIFFVEDIMAQMYLEAVVRRFLSDDKKLMDCKVIPVGGYEQVVTLIENYPSLNYPKNHIQAYLDNDVVNLYNNWEAKGNTRTDGENRIYHLFQNNRNNISYLTLTPELGIWEWIEQNPNVFKNFMDTQHGVQGYRMEDVIAATSAEEQPNKGNNLRAWAKGCFKNFKERINRQNPQISEADVVKDMIMCYVDNHYNFERLKSVFLPLFNRH